MISTRHRVGRFSKEKIQHTVTKSRLQYGVGFENGLKRDVSSIQLLSTLANNDEGGEVGDGDEIEARSHGIRLSVCCDLQKLLLGFTWNWSGCG